MMGWPDSWRLPWEIMVHVIDNASYTHPQLFSNLPKPAYSKTYREDIWAEACMQPYQKFWSSLTPRLNLPYPREEGPMGVAPYIVPRLGGGPIFGIPLSQLDVKEHPDKYVCNLHYLNIRRCYYWFQALLPFESQGSRLSGQCFTVSLTAAVTQMAGLWELYFQ